MVCLRGSGSSAHDCTQQKSSFWSPFWGISAEGRWLCKPIMSHLFRLRCILIRFTLEIFLFLNKKHAKKCGICLKAFYSISVMTWAPDGYFGSSCLKYSIPTGRVSKICPASFCSRPRSKSGFTRPLLDAFPHPRALACFLFISGLWVGPGLCLHQLSSLFSETHCLLVESNFNWNGWRYKSFSVHQNGTAEPSSNH